jgi:hypothetical protein
LRAYSFEQETDMTLGAPPLSANAYHRMANELQTMSEAIRARPEMNHHFAQRLALLAKEMREDCLEEHPPQYIPASTAAK